MIGYWEGAQLESTGQVLLSGYTREGYDEDFTEAGGLIRVV